MHSAAHCKLLQRGGVRHKPKASAEVLELYHGEGPSDASGDYGRLGESDFRHADYGTRRSTRK